MNKDINAKLLKFIENSPTAFHCAAEISKILDAHGYTRLCESDKWNLSEGGKYYVNRNNSSVIAFAVPSGELKSFKIIASHTDFPAFKIKTNPEIGVNDSYIKLNTEKYGGLINYSWFDRPLGIAGRLVVRNGDNLKSILVDTQAPCAVIPSLAVHMNRNVNENAAFNLQNEMLPLFSLDGNKGGYMRMLAEYADVDQKDIVSQDMYLYVSGGQSIWGRNREFITSPRLDNLECAYTTLEGFLDSEPCLQSACVYCAFDNEEVGSVSKQGAGSTFLSDVLCRISSSFGAEREYARLISSSFMLSADNAHALHPNYKDKADETNKPVLNKGVIIKHNAAQRYTTDAVSEAVVKTLLEKSNVPYQYYVNRSDIPGGSTLGNISASHVSLNCADVGLCQLAMHSAVETAGAKDSGYMESFARAFFGSTIIKIADDEYQVR